MSTVIVARRSRPLTRPQQLEKVLMKFNIKPLVRLTREEAAAIDWENEPDHDPSA